MIDESFLKSNFAGKDGFTWWIGRVADPSVWKAENIIMSQSESMGQRCKVRVIGYHPFSGTELPEKDLPWAQVMLSPHMGSGQGAVGDTIPLVGGETCLGFFLDGDEAQQPIIMGVLDRQNNVENAIDPPELASHQSSDGRPFTGNNTDKPTKAKRSETVPIGQGSQGQVKPDSNPKTEQGTTYPKGKMSPAATIFENKFTKEETKPSNCGDDGIGKLTQVLTDFIAFTNMLDNTAGAFIDPLANKIIDIDNEIKKVVSRAQGVIKGVINNIRDGLFGKLTFLFSKFLGTLNLINPLDFINDEVMKKAFQQIMDTIFCIFEKLIEDLFGFLTNLFKSLVSQVINGPFCAAEQFVSGIFAKVFDTLEGLLAPVLSGLDWLVGGLASVQGVLRDVSSLATAIFNFIGCDGKKCTTPSKWISSTNAALERGADDWNAQLDSINLFGTIADDLNTFGNEAEDAIGDFFGSDEFQETEYNGMRVTSVLEATDKLTGGSSAEELNKGLGSIESAIATSTLFGGTNSAFDECNTKRDTPTSQSDIMPMPIGYEYEQCLPPEIAIFGSGSGASATPIVGADGTIFAVQVNSKGSGYNAETSVALIDNTRCGSGGQLTPIIGDDGEIDKIIIDSPGSGYAPNEDNPVGIVTGIFISRPGIGYSSGDTGVIDGTPIDLIISDNGSIGGVKVPIISNNFTSPPDITINTSTGRGASLIPILEYKPQSTKDETNRSGLVGITSVIDCI